MLDNINKHNKKYKQTPNKTWETPIKKQLHYALYESDIYKRITFFRNHIDLLLQSLSRIKLLNPLIKIVLVTHAKKLYANNILNTLNNKYKSKNVFVKLYISLYPKN